MTQAGVGDTAVASTDGSTIVFSFEDAPDTGPMTLIRNGESRTIAVPGPVRYDPVVSPDGSGVLVDCLVAGQDVALLLVG